MFNKKIFTIFTGVYAVIRLFSYFFGPSTPLQGQNLINAIVTIIIAVSTAFFLIRKDPRGWYIIALEIILGGSGNYLAAFGLTLRTWLLMISLPIFIINLFRDKTIKSFFQKEKNILIIFTILLMTIGIGAVNGLTSNHNLSLVIADVLPYIFLLYYFPLKQLSKDETFLKLFTNALAVSVIGNLVLIVLTFIGFSTGLLVLQDSYYHWFRDVAGGKITELGHFYRLVLNEHLLLAPLSVWFSYKIINKEKTRLYTILNIALIVILSVNLTRAYMLALCVSYIFLLTKNNFRRWFINGVFIAVLFISSFTLVHLAATHGTSLGWELFGIRLQSIVSPRIEDSSLSRMLLLPKILDKIKSAPLIGDGLGDTVAVYSPVFKKEVTTAHFDWGYLEIIAELGLIGLIAWIIFGTTIIQYIIKQPKWLFASFVALLVINITSPALFHVFGLIWISILLTNKKTLV